MMPLRSTGDLRRDEVLRHIRRAKTFMQAVVRTLEEAPPRDRERLHMDMGAAMRLAELAQEAIDDAIGLEVGEAKGAAE